jgi:hypothetical protein
MSAGLAVAVTAAAFAQEQGQRHGEQERYGEEQDDEVVGRLFHAFHDETFHGNNDESITE